jgi:hypothetical protein
VGLGVHRRIYFRIEDHLGQAVAVTQIDKDDSAMITPPQNPAHENNFLTDISLAKIVAEMGSA